MIAHEGNGEKYIFVWPFARLRYRIRHGHWCEHGVWYRTGRLDGWLMIDLGRRQMRRCKMCDWVQFR